MNICCVILLFLTIICISTLEASPLMGKGRCICKGSGENSVNRKHIQKIEIYPRNTFCNKTEIIVTLSTNGEKVCLNPASKRVKRALSKMIKKFPEA
ncbi:C-X-C motif chemokine 10-like [Protopterus annectens]|uniref:C-X-C motif chemokine 10-like n=1 Tax=Protopterus annectens TaxID=7888 RepID=UPI001CFBEDE3|nr:C-X-C motif chemokine 10-like [Protopterus annectens]